jgi:hypothetical protein
MIVYLHRGGNLALISLTVNETDLCRADTYDVIDQKTMFQKSSAWIFTLRMKEHNQRLQFFAHSCFSIVRVLNTFLLDALHSAIRI